MWLVGTINSTALEGTIGQWARINAKSAVWWGDQFGQRGASSPGGECSTQSAEGKTGQPPQKAGTALCFPGCAL